MSLFDQKIYIDKLKSINKTPDVITRLSSWMIFYKSEAKLMVQFWFKELSKAQSDKKLALLYLCNDVLQTSRKKGAEFHDAFLPVLPDSLKLIIKDNPIVSYDVMRVLNVWKERSVFSESVIEKFKAKSGLLATTDNLKESQNKLNSLLIKLNQNTQNSRVSTMANEILKTSKSGPSVSLSSSDIATMEKARSHLTDEEALRLELIRDLSVMLGVQKAKLDACKKAGRELDQAISNNIINGSNPPKKRKQFD